MARRSGRFRPPPAKLLSLEQVAVVRSGVPAEYPGCGPTSGRSTGGVRREQDLRQNESGNSPEPVPTQSGIRRVTFVGPST